MARLFFTLTVLVAVAAVPGPAWADLPVGAAELDWYEEFKDWAVALGPALAILVTGGLGFWGVIHRQKADAREALKQRQAEQDRETQRRRDEARALAGALRAEIAVFIKALGSQQRVFQKLHEAGHELDPDLVEAATLLPPEIYFRIIERLTQLPPETVRPVVDFYALLGQHEKLYKQTCSIAVTAKVGAPEYARMVKVSGGVERVAQSAITALDAFMAGEPIPNPVPADEPPEDI